MEKSVKLSSSFDAVDYLNRHGCRLDALSL